MIVPEPIDIVLVYTCDEEGHEFEESIDTFDAVLNYAFHDADPCEPCRGFGLESHVSLDRIEFR